MQFQSKSDNVQKWKWLAIIIGLLIVLVGSLTYAAVLLTPKEYQVKAVYLFNFSKFTRWPDTVFNSPQTPIRICVLGKNPFNNFEILVKDKIVKNRKVTVEQLDSFRKSSRCQILFVSKSEQGNQAAILAYTKQYPILTVSDIKNFVVRGGMVQFYFRGRKVRFMIDPNILKKAGLSASANLLRVAKIVN